MQAENLAQSLALFMSATATFSGILPQFYQMVRRTELRKSITEVLLPNGENRGSSKFKWQIINNYSKMSYVSEGKSRSSCPLL